MAWLWREEHFPKKLQTKKSISIYISPSTKGYVPSKSQFQDQRCRHLPLLWSTWKEVYSIDHTLFPEQCSVLITRFQMLVYQRRIWIYKKTVFLEENGFKSTCRLKPSQDRPLQSGTALSSLPFITMSVYTDQNLAVAFMWLQFCRCQMKNPSSLQISSFKASMFVVAWYSMLDWQGWQGWNHLKGEPPPGRAEVPHHPPPPSGRVEHLQLVLHTTELGSLWVHLGCSYVVSRPSSCN